MLDQAQRLRQLAEKEKVVESKQSSNISRPRIITVTSGKGGVGKSNFVVNMAITLQKRNKKVFIFDADMGMGNDDVLMGFLPKYNVYDVILGDKNIEEVIIEGPHGVKLLPGGTGTTRINEISEKQRDNFIEKLSSLNDIDYVIMDTGAGISQNVLGFAACAEELIVITTPEPTSLTDAYSLLKAVDHFKIKDSAKVIVNRTIDDDDGEVTFRRFNNAVTKFLNIKLEYLGKISEDKKLIQAVRKQQPFTVKYPNSDATRDIENIADKILGLYSNKNGSTVQDLFKKIFNIFS